MELINQYYSEQNDDEYNNIWSCKCRCVTKKAHSTKWAFISIYKKTKINKKKTKINKKKYQEQHIQTEFIEEIELEKDIELDQTINNQNILFPKVRYDKILNKIVIQTNIETDTETVLEKNQFNIDKDKVDEKNSLDNNTIQSNNLLELRNLLFG
jgi:hypothetical protein